ncbi:MAG: [protein-PII] uridylyltransferase [Acidimicrobiales bacterium]|jgi:[protein-PII] uridylyltransferase
MSLRERRQSLIEQAGLQGDAFCRAYSDAADSWLTELFDAATDGSDRGLALVAVGGYGRGELSPFSDLDVVLVHRGRRDVSGIADRIWYPVWDQGIHLDHSVRRPNEVLKVASDDLRTALGLLDARVVCGDVNVADPLINNARDRWVQQKPPWLDDLSERVSERHAAHGDVAFLLEPDLKEAHGGLRDVAALGALVLAVPELANHVDSAAVARSRGVLTRVRVELQRRSSHELNRLLLQEQDQVAAALGEADADSLMLTVAEAGRTIAWEGDGAWRRRRHWGKYTTFGRGRRRGGARAPSPESAPTPTQDPGVAVLDGEVVLLPEADLTDAALPVHVAAVAAERNVPIAREALNALGREAPGPTTPWSDDLRLTLVRVLATGRPAIPALEALDQQELFARFLPEWGAVRNKPQRNAYHRFTVDRHLLEATANAAALADRVDRPDLLLIATLLHDIGKGFPGDHTDAGIELVAEIGARMGFPSHDVDVLVSLVRLHLLLPEMATRRDLDDPATAERVAKEVGDRSTLELLAALVEADSQATGPSAWSAWKAGLMADLVVRTERLLAGEESKPRAPWITDEYRRMIDAVRSTGRPTLALEDPSLTVVAPDRPGLFAQVTGVLALHGLNVQSANVAGETGVAVEMFTVEPSRGRWPDAERLNSDLAAVVDGTLPLDDRLADRTRTYRSEKRPVAPHHVATEITVDNAASASATVIEVRAEDVVGQLHRITRALFECDLDVISAKVNTFGAAVVDAFYVRGPDGQKVTDADLLTAVDAAVRLGVTQQSQL